MMERMNSKTLVRVCEATYDSSLLKSRGITVFDWYFPDGASPPKWVITTVCFY